MGSTTKCPITGMNVELCNFVIVPPKNNNINEPWCKLNKTIKYKKILDFIEIYKKNKNNKLQWQQTLNEYDQLDKKAVGLQENLLI